MVSKCSILAPSGTIPGLFLRQNVLKRSRIYPIAGELELTHFWPILTYLVDSQSESKLHRVSLKVFLNDGAAICIRKVLAKVVTLDQTKTFSNIISVFYILTLPFV